MNRLVFLVISLATGLLVGCGGGGGGAAPVTTTETFQLRAAWINYFTNTGSRPFTVSGTLSGNAITGSGTLTNGSVSSTTFESASAFGKTSSVTGTLSANGTSVPLSSTSTSYTDSNYNPIGSSGSDYIVTQSGTSIPATAKIGDTGVWFTANRYATSAKTSLRGTRTVSFAVEPDTASTALLKIIIVDKNTSGSTTFNDTVTFRMTPSGTLNWLTENAADYTNSMTLNITY